MFVEVKRISDEELEVNGKKVYKDQNNQWVAQNLNQSETKAAHEYIAALVRSKSK